jgi:hypothetical protein
MGDLDRDEVKRLIDEYYAVLVTQEYGDIGSQRLRTLVDGLDQILARLAFEKLAGGLTVLVALDEGAELLSGKGLLRLKPQDLPAVIEDVATIQVVPGEETLLVLAAKSDPLQFAQDAIVYQFQDKDYFVLSGVLTPVINTGPYPSIFGSPTFFELSEALDAYKMQQALRSQCSILSARLWSDDRHWFLCNKPEDVLQDSLYNYLRSTLRGMPEVRREQIVGKRPTDIKVTWSLLTRIAYLEIKWMGKSLSQDMSEISTRFGKGEAIKGAKQLTEYLDDNKAAAATYSTLGILIVFDARRWGIKIDSPELSRKHGFRYRTEEIPYDPAFDQVRADFATPRRFFMEPGRVDD